MLYVTQKGNHNINVYSKATSTTEGEHYEHYNYQPYLFLENNGGKRRKNI